MPYTFDPSICDKCPFGYCFEDRRSNPVRGRKTQFRVLQRNATACTFQDFAPGSSKDFLPGLTFDEYLTQFKNNVNSAGTKFLGSVFKIEGSAFAKVEGDILENLEAAALGNAAAVWNNYMASGNWVSRSLLQPKGAHPDESQRLAIVKMARGYDATRLFTREARAQIAALEATLEAQGTQLKLSAPDIVGVRLPEGVNVSTFSTPIENLSVENISRIETSFRLLEGRISAADFLFALAIKRTMRSDRLYQPLYEANVLKYLIHGLLGQPGFRFYAHALSIEGADVTGHYRAASLYSLIGKKKPERAVDKLIASNSPTEVAQLLLNELPLLTGMVVEV